MTRLDFITKLTAGLSGMPEAARRDIIADYETHFAEGAAAGRSEAEIADALGDPSRLSRELRAEAGLKQWEDSKTPSSALAAVIALCGLGALDILFLLPLIMGVAGALAGFFMAAIGIFVGGGVIFVCGPFAGLPGGFWAAALMGIGIMAAAVLIFCLTLLCSLGLFNFLIWFGRLHYRLIKPALSENTL